jgi:hypothetical protein
MADLARALQERGVAVRTRAGATTRASMLEFVEAVGMAAR